MSLLLLPVGTRIRFLYTLDAYASDIAPARVYAQKDQLGTVTGHGTIEGYWVKADGCDSDFGASRSEFVPLPTMNTPKWNHYHCPLCLGITIARHDDPGTTPFILRCRAKDTLASNGALAHGCNGFAESSLFTGPQDDTQIPHVIFYRPDALTALLDIAQRPKKEHAWLIDHYKNGGALMRENLDRFPSLKIDTLSP